MYIANRRNSSKFNGCSPHKIKSQLEKFEFRNRLLAIY